MLCHFWCKRNERQLVLRFIAFRVELISTSLVLPSRPLEEPKASLFAEMEALDSKFADARATVVKFEAMMDPGVRRLRVVDF